MLRDPADILFFNLVDEALVCPVLLSQIRFSLHSFTRSTELFVHVYQHSKNFLTLGPVARLHRFGNSVPNEAVFSMFVYLIKYRRHWYGYEIKFSFITINLSKILIAFSWTKLVQIRPFFNSVYYFSTYTKGFTMLNLQCRKQIVYLLRKKAEISCFDPTHRLLQNPNWTFRNI